MSRRSSKPKERIIPITMETDDDSVPEPENLKQVKEFAVPSTSKDRMVPVPMEPEESSEQDQEENQASRCVLDTSGSANLDDSIENSSDDNTLKDNPLKRVLPMYNVKEKIILVVDSAEDEDFTPFRLHNAQISKPLDTLKRAVEIFLQNKHFINRKHEYALAVLNDNNVLWLKDFTSNIKEVINALQKMNPCQTEDIFPLNTLFDAILQNVDVPELLEAENVILPPNYIVRTILLYGRSYTMPKLIETEEIGHLLKSPYFTFDVVMTHEPVDDNNNCNRIFNVLQNLDRKGFAYFFPVARNARTLFGSMGKLLGHPLQRAPQPLANYSIQP